MKKYIKIVSLVVMLLINNGMMAQMEDLSIVWDNEHYGDGYLESIHPTSSRDGYLGTGALRGINDNYAHTGLIVKFNESGALTNRIEIDIKDVYTPTAGVNYDQANISIKSAFEYKDISGKTWITAFAMVTNRGEILSELSDISAPTRYYLREGVFVLKIDSETNKLVSVRRESGTNPAHAVQLSDNTILVGGAGRGVSAEGNNLMLLRLYGEDGTLLDDASTSVPNTVIRGIQYNPTSNSLVAVTMEYFFNLSITGGNYINLLNAMSVKNITSSEGISFPRPGKVDINNNPVVAIGPQVFSLTNDGGIFFFAYLIFSNASPQLYDGGNGLFRFDKSWKDDNIAISIYDKTTEPSTEIFMPPILLPGNNLPATYVGLRKTNINPNLGVYSDNSTINEFYFLNDDITQTFTENVTTTTKQVASGSVIYQSISDGFFVVGNNDNTIKIQKYSTCSSFKVLDNDNKEIKNTVYKYSLPANNIINFQETFRYIDALAASKEDVSYKITWRVAEGVVNGKNKGEVINIDQGTAADYILNTTTGKGFGKFVDVNKTFIFENGAGKIEAEIYIENTYQVAGISQKCQRTFFLNISILPQTDVVAMPTLKQDGTKNILRTTIKNIGYASFVNYKITIYEDFIDSSTSFTYSHPTAIGVNETVHLKIDLSPTPLANASKVVVCFNDDGSGALHQAEGNDKQFTYEVEL